MWRGAVCGVWCCIVVCGVVWCVVSCCVVFYCGVLWCIVLSDDVNGLMMYPST